jgi:predicted molibdopterin-dependent oxidoreductase YjgC
MGSVKPKADPTDCRACSGQCTNEENYLLSKFTRRSARTTSITAPVSDAPPAGLPHRWEGSQLDPVRDDTNCFLIIGSNTSRHPLIATAFSKQKRGALVVLDPRKNQIGHWADPL